MPPPTQYGIVLDAGSSHTAMFVYKWPADKENDTGVVGEHSMCDVEGKSCPSLPGPVLVAGSVTSPAGTVMGECPAMPRCLSLYSPVQ